MSLQVPSSCLPTQLWLQLLALPALCCLACAYNLLMVLTPSLFFVSRLLGYTFISKSWRRSEEGKGERLIFYLLVHSPMNVTRAGLGWTKLRVGSSILVSQIGGRDSSSWFLLWFHWLKSRELGYK